MNICFISSMNHNLYEFYGKRFLEEFAKFSDDNLKLFIMFEGPYQEEILHISEKIIVLPLSNLNHANFLKKFSHLHEANGLRIKNIDVDGIKQVKLVNDYRWNAIRFSFKPFSIFHALDFIPENLDCLIWTDSDLRCKKNFNADNLIEFMPKDLELMSYLGRKNSYSECGFLSFNLKNEMTISYIKRMIEIYETGEIFSLEQWHDSFIWDWARKDFELNKGAKFKNISGDAYDKEHVFINTKLGNYFDHLKGPNRKKQGQSSEEDRLRKISGKILL